MSDEISVAKPYDVKELLSEFKAHGLDLAEDASKVSVKALFAWLSKSASASENKMDDLLLAILPVIEPHVMDQLDKIDGKEG